MTFGGADRLRPLPEPDGPGALLDIRSLDVRFAGHAAVTSLDLRIDPGETLALVGESGCGKSTTALAILRLLPSQARLSGTVAFEGRNLLALKERDLARIRGKAVSIVFQEPMTSLNPVLSIGRQVMEAITLHERRAPRQAREEALALLDRVRLPDPVRLFDDYPHQLSGGQRQRVMIAMAVACRPRLLIADEPTTALDVTIQAQILRLIDDLRRDLGMAVLLITHDLGVVAQWADRVAVMHHGRKLEEGPTRAVFARPRSLYTRGLLGASLHGGRALHYGTARLAEIHHRGDDVFDLVRPPARPARPRPENPIENPIENRCSRSRTCGSPIRRAVRRCRRSGA